MSFFSKEINPNVGADEMNGEMVCRRCNGWGFVDIENLLTPEQLEDHKKLIKEGYSDQVFSVCPECRGSCIVDWAKAPTQRKKND